MLRRWFLSVFAIPVWAVGPPRPPAPAFRGKAMDGTVISNESLKGKPALIQFWATWCGYCRRDEPAVEQIVKEYSPDRLTVLAVNVGEAKGKVKDYLDRNRRTPKVVLNQDTNLPAMFRPEGFPVYVLLDEQGRIANRQDGAGGILALRELLKDVGLRKAAGG